MRQRILGTVLVACLLLSPSFALAQDAASAAGIALSGEGITASQLMPERLAALPSVTMEVSFQTSKGEEKATYKGVLVWTVLEKAGLLKADGRHAELKRGFTITGRDGYAVRFSVGEIAPDFGNKPIIVALTRDGKPLAAGALRVIVPGDKRGARSVKDVVSITLN